MDEMTHDQHAGELNPDVHHEESDVNVRAILWFVVGFIVIMVLIYLAMAGLFVGLKSMEASKDAEPLTMVKLPHPRVPPEPRLQVNPGLDMKILSAEYTKQMSTEGWIDEKRGVKRIPIDQAMKAVVAQGMPTRVEKSAAPVVVAPVSSMPGIAAPVPAGVVAAQGPRTVNAAAEQRP